MQSQPVQLPLEQASDAVAPVLQPWILDASRPYADWYFGDAEAAAAMTAEFVRRPTSELYVGRATLMRDLERQPIGCIVGLSGAELASCRAADFAAFCEALQDHPECDEIAAQTIAASRELFPEVAEDEFYLSRVALDPARR